VSLGWRPHDLETSFVPFFHGIGVQVGISDPVFMARYGKQPVTDHHPEFPYDAAKFDRELAAGDPKVQEATLLGMEWIKEVHVFRDWEDLKFLRDNWEGPLVVKGILSTHVRFFFLSLAQLSDILFRMRKKH
jgi:lactate 2-monooxygenase